MKCPAVDGIPVSTPLKLADPGKKDRQKAVWLTGTAVAVPEMTNVPPVPDHEEISKLS